MNYISKYNSPLGLMTMVSDGIALTGLVFDQQKHFNKIVPEDAIEKSVPIFNEVNRWLTIYFQGKEPDFTPHISMEGSSFRKEVWDMLKQIPYGHVITYGNIAKQIAGRQGITKMSAQAVGGAVGHNPISIIVPCHRVVGQNGTLTGYAGGIDRKIKLLQLEGVSTIKEG